MGALDEYEAYVPGKNACEGASNRYSLDGDER